MSDKPANPDPPPARESSAPSCASAGPRCRYCGETEGGHPYYGSFAVCDTFSPFTAEARSASSTPPEDQPGAPGSSSSPPVPGGSEVLDGVTVAGARAFWKAQDLLNAMQAIATDTMVALSDPHRASEEYRGALTAACRIALAAIDGAQPMKAAQNACGNELYRDQSPVPGGSGSEALRALDRAERACDADNLDNAVDCIREARRLLLAEGRITSPPSESKS